MADKLVSIKSVKIQIGKEEIEISMDELRQLKSSLEELFGQPYYYVPYNAPVDSQFIPSDSFVGRQVVPSITTSATFDPNTVIGGSAGSVPLSNSKLFYTSSKIYPAVSKIETIS